ncbi:MAG: UDP-N-acetylglucosamine--N-acetylmuramyl-(pentapeptide) pyrophosphoryl-undecaprenol N-acetylglucosamine transferase, partial [Miltoncostaeaceae bacterium]
FTLKTVGALALAVWATQRAAGIQRRRSADVVLGSGSYVVGPMALAARLGRRGLVLMEADSHLGLANRICAPLARRVTLAFPLQGRGGRRYRVTGRPVSAEVRAATRTGGRRAFGLDPDATVVLVVGGSQGARSLNRAAVEAFGDDPPFEVIHVAGPTQEDQTRTWLDEHSPGSRYHLFSYLDNLPEAIAAADLVVARSGGSVFELAAVGRPSILVPYPHATADHQAANARWLAEAGAAVVVRDEELTGPGLRDLVGALLSDRPRLEAMARAGLEVGKPDAAQDVADEVFSALPRRRRSKRTSKRRRDRRRRVRVPRPGRPSWLRIPRVRFPRIRWPRLRRRR